MGREATAFMVEEEAPPKPIANISMPRPLSRTASAIAAGSPPLVVCCPSVISMITLRGEVLEKRAPASLSPSEIAVSPLAGPYLLMAESIADCELLI